MGERLPPKTDESSSPSEPVPPKESLGESSTSDSEDTSKGEIEERDFQYPRRLFKDIIMSRRNNRVRAGLMRTGLMRMRRGR